MKAHIETSESSARMLICYYEGLNWDEAIKNAEREFGVENGRIGVIAIPANGLDSRGGPPCVPFKHGETLDAYQGQG